MIDVGTMFSKSWEKYSPNLGQCILVYLVGAIVGSLLSGLTLGILGIPVYAGLFKAFRRASLGQAPEFNDLFSEFGNFAKWFMLWVVMLVVGVAVFLLNLLLAVTGIGLIVLPFVGVAVGLFLYFTIPLMLERNMAAFDAVRESVSKVAGNFSQCFLPMLLTMIVAGAGGVALGIGVLFTAPWMLIAYWLVYDSVYGGPTA